MKRKIYVILKRYKGYIVSFGILIFLIILLMIFHRAFSKQEILKIETDSYIISYDNTWNITEQTDQKVNLKHKQSDSKISIEIQELENDSNYLEISDFIEEIRYLIETQNTGYRLLGEEEATFTDYQYKGYKLLYEQDDTELFLATFKKGEKLIVFTYEATHNYFDILFSSMENILYNLEVKEEIFPSNEKINIPTSSIGWEQNENLTPYLTDVTEHTIANNHYEVTYTLPSVFKQATLNSTFHYLTLEDVSNESISLDVSIYTQNIYEYLDPEEIVSLSYNFCEEKEEYECEEALEKTSDNPLQFTYKRTYKDNASSFKQEKVEIIAALDEQHILIMNMVGNDSVLSKELIDRIELTSITHYASYITSTKENGSTVAQLKRFRDYENENMDIVTIFLPNKYSEYEEGNNIYERRYFHTNYNEEKEWYDYEISYRLTAFSITDLENEINTLNHSFTDVYGFKQDLIWVEEKTLNNKNFQIYQGGYRYRGGIPFTTIDYFLYDIHKTVLAYAIPNGGFLLIEISGNDKEITDDMLQEATNFVIETKN